MLHLSMIEDLGNSYGGCMAPSASNAAPEFISPSNTEPEAISASNAEPEAPARPNTRSVAAANRHKYPYDLAVFKKRPRLHDQHEIATLCNIGNSCYLNSVLYTLRFAPNFLHNLHHLVVEQNNNCIDGPRSNHQIAIEELHELYTSLHTSEVIESPDAFHTRKFLTAMQNVNSVFKGNHQQDAHEFLMCILNSIQETCVLANYSMLGHIGLRTESDVSRNWHLNSFRKDFEGVTKSSTKCVRCNTVTENEQTMYYLSVPINDNNTTIPLENPNLFFQTSCVTEEKFDISHNYRCMVCNGVMEAIRSVSYPALPRLLIFQLMRFSTGMTKIKNYVPTPLTIHCFCNQCYELSDDKKLHVYKLYGVIAHVGARLSSGHYIAYTSSLAGHSEKSCVIEQRDVLLNGSMESALSTNEKPTSFHCCGILTRNASAEMNGHHPNDDCSEGSDGDINISEPTWYKCDDEKIKKMTQHDFVELLEQTKRKVNTISPYLIFYARSTRL